MDNMKSTVAFLKALKEDGKVFIKKEQCECFKSLLDQKGICYYEFDVSQNEVLIELAID